MQTTMTSSQKRCMVLMSGLFLLLGSSFFRSGQSLSSLKAQRQSSLSLPAESQPAVSVAIGKQDTKNNLRNLASSGKAPTKRRVLSGNDSGNKPKKVKVFFLAGQSNMLGYAPTKALKGMLKWEKHQNNWPLLWNHTSKDFNIQPHVYIKHQGHFGHLTLGHDTRFAGQDNKYGPEVGFGFEMSKLATAEEPVYLIKAAYGGRDLAIDFRPPSSNKGHYTKMFAGFTEHEKKEHAAVAKQAGHVDFGRSYRDMILEFHQGLKAMPKIVDGAPTEYSIEGMVWMQGASDLEDEEKSAEYPYNLKNLIKDVRKEFKVDMPFVVAETGMHGVDPSPKKEKERILAFRESVKAVTLTDELKDNTLYVPTAQYANTNPKTKRYEKIFHYYGRPETIVNIGVALADGMMQLMGAKKASATKR